jgi:hypothetical protein
MAKMTIGQLMKIDAGRIGKAAECNVQLIKVFHELKKVSLLDKFKAFFNGRSIVNSYFVIFKLQVISTSGKPYTVFIRTCPDFDLKNWEDNECKIYCSCPHFKFRSAYTLNQRGALFINNRIQIELGQAISDKPKKEPSLLCKHSFAALTWLVANYSNVMQTV